MKVWILHKKIEEEVYELERFHEVAKEENIDIKVIQPEEIDLMVTREDRKSILLNGEVTELPDVVLPRMGSGTTYFALAIIRHLERLGVKCFNSSESIEIAKDKLYTQQILAENNLPVPKTMLVKFPVNIDLIEKYIGFPIVVKSLSGSQGKGVFLSKSKLEFRDLMQLIEITNPSTNIILQEFIDSSNGRDLRVFTIGGKSIRGMERISSNESFKANFSQGATVKSYKLTPEIEWLVFEISRILNLDIAGIDLLFDKTYFKICEVNSSPGFHGLESCCDINIPKEIFHFLKVRLNREI